MGRRGGRGRERKQEKTESVYTSIARLNQHIVTVTVHNSLGGPIWALVFHPATGFGRATVVRTIGYVTEASSALGSAGGQGYLGFKSKAGRSTYSPPFSLQDSTGDIDDSFFGELCFRFEGVGFRGPSRMSLARLVAFLLFSSLLLFSSPRLSTSLLSSALLPSSLLSSPLLSPRLPSLPGLTSPLLPHRAVNKPRLDTCGCSASRLLVHVYRLKREQGIVGRLDRRH